MATLKRIYNYYPKAADNLDKPEDERFYVRMKQAEVKVRNERMKEFLSIKEDKLMEYMLDEKMSAKMRALLDHHVVSFVNLDFEEEDGTIVPITVAHLWEMGEFQLITELFHEIIGASQLKSKKKDSKDDDGDEAKNSESPFGTTATPNEV